MKRDRGWRKQQNDRIIKKRKRLLRDVSKYMLEYFDGKENKLAIKHPLDCGKTDCGICAGHKRNKACKSKSKDIHGLLEEILKRDIPDEANYD
jgi:hypothetical protein